ncbi:MAG: hypothetical protein EZS28_016497 [Streblomastix strix]|uniref:Uncharacterized protein n=1 Tax=Streblomastix strix TaxID=222440 RepID=A0A5J4VZ65_9EUKA|nr:MAG: hypothetical protein EZS28_016497 [Streblomastix strix]
MKLDIAENSAYGDFAFSAQSGPVWMYEQNWQNSGDIVPDQVTPASDANPLVDSRTGVAGTSTEYSRENHQHSLNIQTDSSIKPQETSNEGSIGKSTKYAKENHSLLFQGDDTVKPGKYTESLVNVERY